jgi:hypothetical protein
MRVVPYIIYVHEVSFVCKSSEPNNGKGKKEGSVEAHKPGRRWLSLLCLTVSALCEYRCIPDMYKHQKDGI